MNEKLDIPIPPRTIVMVRLGIVHKPGRVIFDVMPTPAALWEVLPQIPRALQVSDYAPDPIHYKRFDFKFKGCNYEFVFYFPPGTASNKDTE